MSLFLCKLKKNPLDLLKQTWYLGQARPPQGAASPDNGLLSPRAGTRRPRPRVCAGLAVAAAVAGDVDAARFVVQQL